MRVNLKAMAGVVMLLVSVDASAHHSFAMFDRGKEVSLVGEVRDFHWSNPHSWIFLIVKDNKGHAVEWKLEGGSPNLLQRDGWTRRSLGAGSQVTVVVHPSKDGTTSGSVISVTLADGTKLGSR